MNEIARQKLIDLVARHGGGVADDARRCKALLRDAFGDQFRREVNVLVAALEDRTPVELRNSAGTLSGAILLARLSQRLHDHHGIDEGVARWSVETWAVALGIVRPSQYVADLDGGVTMKLVGIEPGEFLMGSPPSEESRCADEFQHKVRLTKPLMMGIQPVTRRQFAAFANATAHESGSEKEDQRHIPVSENRGKVSGQSWQKPGFAQTDDHPVVCMSWNDAMAFVQWLSRKKAKRFRLPTEAEWEYACRAGTTTPFHVGLTISTSEANYRGEVTTPVDFYKPNPWGLYDMHGNVWEWCSDRYGEYPRGEVEDPAGGSADWPRVLRGGSWASDRRGCRAAFRGKLSPDHRYFNVGFRICLDL
jgi:formylglycine-generating enzyme required for sulfatase activity